MQSVVPTPLWEPKTREFRKRGYSLQLLFESRSVLILLAKLQGKIQFFPLLSRTFVPE